MDFEEFCLCHFRVDLVTKDTLLAVSTDELLPVVVIEMVDRVDVCMRCSACRRIWNWVRGDSDDRDGDVIVVAPVCVPYATRYTAV